MLSRRAPPWLYRLFKSEAILLNRLEGIERSKCKYTPNEQTEVSAPPQANHAQEGF
jgi:hypothetical protein